MKILLLIFLFLSFQANSQGKKDTLIENALLWEISGNDLKAPSYMYGTTHMFCSNDIVLSPVLISKLLSAKSFYVETAYWKKAFENGYLEIKNDKSLRKQLGSFCYKQTKQLLESYYGPVTDESLDTFSIIKVLIKLREVNLKCSVISYDDTLYNIARANHLELKDLETIEQHQPRESGIEFTPTPATVCNYISIFKRNAASYTIHKKHYLDRDLNWLYQQAAYTPSGDEAPHKKEYLDKRNKAWIAVMEASMKEAVTFFAFGCAHLAGRLGLIPLLREKGYTVTPVY